MDNNPAVGVIFRFLLLLWGGGGGGGGLFQVMVCQYVPACVCVCVCVYVRVTEWSG